MDPDDAPPRLRWRLLAWLAGALLLLPVLYVAASGPLTWWNGHRYSSTPDWLNDYYATLQPLEKQPQIGPSLDKYYTWWAQLPAPRFMRRQSIVDRLNVLRVQLERERKFFAETQERLTALQGQLESLDSRTDLTPEQSREAVQLRSYIADRQNRLETNLRPGLSSSEEWVQRAEEELREFDAGKR